MSDRFVIIGFSGDRKTLAFHDTKSDWYATVDTDDCDGREMLAITEDIVADLNDRWS